MWTFLLLDACCVFCSLFGWLVGFCLSLLFCVGFWPPSYTSCILLVYSLGVPILASFSLNILLCLPITKKKNVCLVSMFFPTFYLFGDFFSICFKLYYLWSIKFLHRIHIAVGC